MRSDAQLLLQREGIALEEAAHRMPWGRRPSSTPFKRLSRRETARC